jgi:hypothetical protein
MTLAGQRRSTSERLNMPVSNYLLALAAAGVAQSAAAVIVRHDVPIAGYEAKARGLPGYCQLEVPDGGGVLVAPTWVLTAAHLAGEIKVGHRFHCGSETETVAEVIVNPAFDEKVGRDDLALVRLSSASAIAPVPLLHRALANGELVVLIGHYQGGTGLTGGVGRDPAGLRAATNRVAQVDRHWLRFVFDAPSSSATTPLEGVSGAGDSGAPAYATSGGKVFVAGIGSRSIDSNRNGVEQDYGDTDLYVPVATYLDWIARVIAPPNP